jgi:NAD(P)-dependent dehydrogenase (short-subunit alcohol dehydrogenase family)
MDLELEGARAAVMAASRGLGRAAAEALAEEGCDVAIGARDEKRLRATADAIAEATGRDVEPIAADVSEAAEVDGFVDEAVERLGGLDVLVTNKGGPPPGGFEDVDDEGWQAGFELVVLSYVRAVRAALPHLKEGGGSVVSIESTSVKRPIEGLLLSNALRPSVVATSKTLAREHADEGVRFNVVLPGSMATDRLDELFASEAEARDLDPDEVREEWEADIPAGRLGEPRELGEVVCFLASPKASYATGGVYPVDGGKTPNVY